MKNHEAEQELQLNTFILNITHIDTHTTNT